jgi:hypothetical protein
MRCNRFGHVERSVYETRDTILRALTTGPKSEDDLLAFVRSILGEEPDDYRDALDDLIDVGKVKSEVNEYLQQDIYEFA